MSQTYDIAVVGSGFAGSLVAMIAHRLGHSVVLLERGTHPRFAIGESSTPLSNLLLEDIATRYNLPRIRPLSKWGTWQENYPNVACGMKRGFTFYHHDPGRPSTLDQDHLRQLFVAASPHNYIADTHWLRSDFDELLVHEAQASGVEHIDQVRLDRFVDDGDAVTLSGMRNGEPATFRARFVVDATGPRGFLHHTLDLAEATLPNYPATQALFSHFTRVTRLDDVSSGASSELLPYPIDDSSVHHIFEGGWIWVFQFNNGITSAGVATTDEAFSRLQLADGEPAWERLLTSIPALQVQFASARLERPFSHAKRLPFLSQTIHGDRWALLPSAAGFIDPLLSTGFPLTLLGVSRLGKILEDDWNTPRFNLGLEDYAERTRNEILATSRLISSLYANMNNFPVFKALSLLYFAAASFSETARRLNKPHLATSFLLHDHPTFGPQCQELLERSHCLRTKEESGKLIADILRVIEPIDVAGLCNRDRNHCYPVDAQDLITASSKVGATADEMMQLLRNSGFYQS